MAACIPSMGISPREPYRGTIHENKITKNLKIKHLQNLSTLKKLTIPLYGNANTES